MNFKIKYLKGQISPFGAVAEGAGIITTVALDKAAIDTVGKLTKGKRAKARKHKRKVVA